LIDGSAEYKMKESKKLDRDWESCENLGVGNQKRTTIKHYGFLGLPKNGSEPSNASKTVSIVSTTDKPMNLQFRAPELDRDWESCENLGVGIQNKATIKHYRFLRGSYFCVRGNRKDFDAIPKACSIRY
jgi:hypothetical protein